MFYKFIPLSLLFALFLSFSTVSFAETSAEPEEEFNFSEMIMHHVTDAHEWHFATIGHTHVTIPLPVILYNTVDKKWDVFLSNKFHSEGFEGEGEHEQHNYKGYFVDDHNHIAHIDGKKFYDFSITKNVASLLLSAVLLIVVFFTIAGAYKKNHGKAPKGIQSFFEPIVMFIRDDIAKTAIVGHDKHGKAKYEKYLPYLLTVFFFIWFNNLLGLMPGGANLTGNIAVTLILALITLCITLFSSNKYYWQHIFATPGVPAWLLPIMIPVELVGILTKPFSLMIRLFANITAGHIIILSLLGLIFVAKHIAASIVIIPFALFMNAIELMVAILQAYIFTLLSAMYIGSAVEGHEAHDDYGH
ncbi:F0F1 ATP synthase subunit A [Rhodocytophaga rosea]|uniref:ATP synthase subunit a n=1 Tax=Rhodocytophaga rosea TaxID=2704465 RepID=A0A6C0GW44_9BACT|nr:F0F1 ATP synthase subunit A [Rhodocytophaga rosea]